MVKRCRISEVDDSSCNAEESKEVDDMGFFGIKWGQSVCRCDLIECQCFGKWYQQLHVGSPIRKWVICGERMIYRVTHPCDYHHYCVFLS
jgi:hypothetical protein